MKKTISVIFIILMSVSAYAFTSNWYAEEHFSLGKRYYEYGQYNKALKELQEAVVAYETSVMTERSLERGKIYYYMALTYFKMLENYAINNPTYKLLTIKAMSVMEKAIEIKWQDPVVNKYYSSNPNLLFKFDALSFIPEVREYQEMKNLQKLFAKREKSNIFSFSRNINMKHNILEMGGTFFRVTEPNKSDVKEEPAETKPAETQKTEVPVSQPAEESKKKAQEVEKKTDEIMPTIY